MLSDLLAQVAKRFDGQGPSLAAIARVASARSAARADPFMEPLSTVSGPTPKEAKIELTAGVCNAWAKHTAYAMRARMEALEISTLRAFLDGQVVPAGVLVRAHLEAAGTAAYAVQELNRAMDAGRPEVLQNVVGGVLLGTSLYRLAKKNDPLASAALEPGALNTLAPGDVVAALDAFTADKRDKGFAARWYGMLCDYAHPNLRGTKENVRILEERGDAWLLQYDPAAEFTEAHAGLFTEVLAFSSRHGFGASEFLLRVEFTDAGTLLRYRPPSRQDLQYIYSTMYPEAGLA